MKKNSIFVECKNCNNKFKTWPSIIKQGRGIYCSKKCLYSFRKGKPSWNKGVPWSKEYRQKMSIIGKQVKHDYWKGKKRPEAYIWMIKAQKEKGIVPHFIHGLSKTKEYQRTKHKEYFEKNKEYVYAQHRQRFYLKKGIMINGTHTEEEWEELKKQYSYCCLSCKEKEPEIKLTRDHVVPLIKFGYDTIQNIQPLCLSCNVKKHIKTIDFRLEYNQMRGI